MPSHESVISDIEPSHLDIAAASIAEPAVDSLERKVRIHILAPDEQTTCGYWLGLYREGTLKAGEVIESETLSSAFSRAFTPGIAEKRHVMIADTGKGDLRILSLIPASADTIKPIDREAFSEALKTITSWPPETLGICLNPEIMTSSSARSLSIELISSLMKQTKITDFVIDPSGFWL